MESKTQTGLLLLIIGISIMLIFALIIIPITGLITPDFNIMIISVVFVIVSLIGFILFIVGAIYFIIGAKEFGEKHQKNVNLAIIIFVINFVLTYVFGILVSLVLYMTISSFTEIDTTPSLIIYVIRTIVSAILVGLIYYYALIELEDEIGKKVLYSGIISSISISVIISIISLSVIDYQIRQGITILSVIPLFLFIIALYIPYTRIKQGKLNPQLLPAYPSTVPQRNCPNCKNQIPFDSLLCPYCGVKFRK